MMQRLSAAGDGKRYPWRVISEGELENWDRVLPIPGSHISIEKACNHIDRIQFCVRGDNARRSIGEVFRVPLWGLFMV